MHTSDLTENQLFKTIIGQYYYIYKTYHYEKEIHRHTIACCNGCHFNHKLCAAKEHAAPTQTAKTGSTINIGAFNLKS